MAFRRPAVRLPYGADGADARSCACMAAASFALTSGGICAATEGGRSVLTWFVSMDQSAP